MLTDTPLHREEIKAKLRIRFGTMDAFEKAKNLPRRSVKDVLRGRGVRRAAEAIAEELGIPLQSVSPLYFELAAQGDNRQRRRRSHRLNAEAR